MRNTPASLVDMVFEILERLTGWSARKAPREPKPTELPESNVTAVDVEAARQRERERREQRDA
ncbi:MAG: hypothetical protein HY874_12590 [Chloroflexi bacterium]|nr:hypothetical protein [Chloroflexota bacterium]